jgi:hypothetical protein
MKLVVEEGVLRHTFLELRKCGQGRTECVVYWTSRVESQDRVDEVLHPAHRSTRGSYELDDRWLTNTSFELMRRQRSIRAQVHTHPGDAFHSPTDDHYPVIAVPGFLSLVIPRFGSGAITLAGAYLGEMQADGSWKSQHIDDILVLR